MENLFALAIRLDVGGADRPVVEAVAKAVEHARVEAGLVRDIVLNLAAHVDADRFLQGHLLDLHVVVPVLVAGEEPAVDVFLRDAVDLLVLVVPEPFRLAARHIAIVRSVHLAYGDIPPGAGRACAPALGVHRPLPIGRITGISELAGLRAVVLETLHLETGLFELIGDIAALEEAAGRIVDADHEADGHRLAVVGPELA